MSPPRGSPPSATSGPGSTTLQAVASHVPSGARVSSSPTGSSFGTTTSQSEPEGLRTSIVRSTSPLTRCSTSTVRKSCGVALQLSLPLGDDASDDRRIGVVEPLGERFVRTDARRRRAREREREQQDDEECLQTSISSASP